MSTAITVDARVFERPDGLRCYEARFLSLFFTEKWWRSGDAYWYVRTEPEQQRAWELVADNAATRASSIAVGNQQADVEDRQIELVCARKLAADDLDEALRSFNVGYIDRIRGYVLQPGDSPADYVFTNRHADLVEWLAGTGVLVVRHIEQRPWWQLHGM